MAASPTDQTEPLRATPGQWARNPERGSGTLLRAMIFISLRFGRPAARCVLYLIALYFYLFAPTARRHSRDYLRRVLGRAPTGLDRFRQVFSFASTLLDRLYLINERFELFDVSLEGEKLMRELLDHRSGAFLLGAHLGSFEILGAVGRSQPGLHLAMAMYGEVTPHFDTLLQTASPAVRPEIIPLGHMEAMLRIRECLEQGMFVGMLADRTMSNQPALAVSFLGRPALFPMGPMRVAAILRQPVIFMAGLYRGGNRYHVVFEQLADFTHTPSSQREAAVKTAIERYAALLEKYCRSDPFNWFNFYDFWQGA